MTAPFRTVPQQLAPKIGPHELLDIIAAAEGARMEARKLEQRAAEAAAKFGSQLGYRVNISVQEARRLASAQVAGRHAA